MEAFTLPAGSFPLQKSEPHPQLYLSSRQSVSGMLHCTQKEYCRRELGCMAKPWDETMKKLIHANPQDLLDWLNTGGTFLHFEPTELFRPKEKRRKNRYGPTATWR